MTNTIPYTTCATCNTPLGIHSVTEKSVAKINGYSILFGKDKGYHLRQQCCPSDADEFVSLIFNFIGKLGHYTDKCSKQREINIDKCSICLSEFSDNPSLLLFELPCQHIICVSCLFEYTEIQKKTTNEKGEPIYKLEKNIAFKLTKCPICRTPIKQNIKEFSRQYTMNSSTPPTLKPFVERTKSTNLLTRSCTSPSYSPDSKTQYNCSFHTLHKFDKQRFIFWDSQDPLTAPVNNIPCNTMLTSKSPLLINVVTDKSCTFNDVLVYKYNTNGEFNGVVSFNNHVYSESLFNFKMEHCGDKVKKEEIKDNITLDVLYHNILITSDTQYTYKIVSLDKPCNNSLNLTSIFDPNPECQQSIQFQHMYEYSKDLLEQENLQSILIVSQITYVNNKTLRELSPLLNPSTAFLTTNEDNHKTVNVCEWSNDDCAMNTWTIIGIYSN